MARVKGALNARKKHKKVLKLARGYRGARSKQYRVAKQSVMKAMAFAFAGRKQTKREYRSLWIVRINAAARMNEISYSKLIHGLKVAGVNINRTGCIRSRCIHKAGRNSKGSSVIEKQNSKKGFRL